MELSGHSGCDKMGSPSEVRHLVSPTSHKSDKYCECAGMSGYEGTILRHAKRLCHCGTAEVYIVSSADVALVCILTDRRR